MERHPPSALLEAPEGGAQGGLGWVAVAAGAVGEQSEPGGEETELEVVRGPVDGRAAGGGRGCPFLGQGGDHLGPAVAAAGAAELHEVLGQVLLEKLRVAHLGLKECRFEAAEVGQELLVRVLGVDFLSSWWVLVLHQAIFPRRSGEERGRQDEAHNPANNPNNRLAPTQRLHSHRVESRERGLGPCGSEPRPGGPPTMKKSASPDGRPASLRIDERIAELGDWRGEVLGRLRALIHQADPDGIEEWKWNVPVWSHDGLICTGETYKKVVKLTFAKGASLPDPSGLFNSSLEGNTRRAIDFGQGVKIDEEAFKALIRAAVVLNQS